MSSTLFQAAFGNTRGVASVPPQTPAYDPETWPQSAKPVRLSRTSSGRTNQSDVDLRELADELGGWPDARRVATALLHTGRAYWLSAELRVELMEPMALGHQLEAVKLDS